MWRSRASELLFPHARTDDGKTFRPRRATTVLLCLLIFLAALGVRLLHWQDNRPVFHRVFISMVGHYRENARLLLAGDVETFIKGPSPPEDANVLNYPPGYAILSAALFKLTGERDAALRAAQIVCDALGAVLIFLIALELFPVGVGLLAGLLTALSPQLSYYSVLLLPDSPTVLPVLFAVYLIIRAWKRPRLLTIIVAGASVGLACWLRANALLLSPFLAVLVFLLFDRARRVRYAAAFVCATVLVVAPITIRNFVVFRSLIPLSLTAGYAMQLGIADYDKEKRFGLPATDIETLRAEAAAHNRPDYEKSLFGAGGIEREHERMARAVAIIRSHPFWFAGVVLSRATSLLRLERVNPVSAAPAVTRSFKSTLNSTPAWTAAPAELMAEGASAPAAANVSLSDDGSTLRVVGDLSSANGFVSPSLAVEKNSDYVLRVPVRVDEGSVVVSVVSADGDQTYGSTPVINPLERLAPSAQAFDLHLLPFASRDEERVRIHLSGARSHPTRVAASVGRVELFRLGPASLLWTRHLRALVRLVQRFFVTAWMLPLALAGLALLLLAGRGRVALILLAVPAYYVSSSSVMHAEYRYLLAAHPFVFVLAGVALYAMAAAMRAAFRKLCRRGQTDAPTNA